MTKTENKFKYLIVGGGIAGTTAAEVIRQNDASGSVAIISDEPYPLYSRVLLSKPSFLLGKKPFDQIWLKDKSWYVKNKIVLLAGKTATALDPANKIVSLGAGSKIGYERLLLALGVRARPWTVPGAQKREIFYLRTLADAQKLSVAIKDKKHAVVIGSGCVSFETLAVLREAGIEVTTVMLEKYFWEPMLDETGGRMAEKALLAAGVELLPQAEVQEVLGGESVEGVILKNGRKIDCEMIICGIGVSYPTEWLKEAGVKVNKGVLANEYLETSIPDIWTAGDVAEFNDLVLKETLLLGNWLNACEQGRIAGLNMTGKKEPLKLVSFYISQAFGVTVAFTGDIRLLPERRSISRGSPEINSYGRLLTRENQIIGATLVNRIAELGTITKLIRNNIDISAKEQELADPNFDLQRLL